ncbi:MAG: hypothetical protein Tsb0015_04230 [Simkaniaceae bacterium]
MDVSIKQREIKDGAPLAYIGPDLQEGPLPGIVYLALSKEESLLTPPFNRPALKLKDAPLRLFSVTLPFHGNGLDPVKAIPKWAEEFQEGKDILEPFLREASHSLKFLLREGFVTKLGAIGLSRGALIAAHLAAKIPDISHIVGFAPLTQLSAVSDFSPIRTSYLVKQYDMENLIPSIYNRSIRFYIGNYDRRVGTEKAFAFIHSLAKYAYDQRLRSVPIELYIRPSIGYQGHGTGEHTFDEGTEWLKEQLLLQLP